MGRDHGLMIIGENFYDAFIQEDAKVEVSSCAGFERCLDISAIERFLPG